MSRKPKPTFPSTNANGGVGELRLFRQEADCQVLGPGRRAVLWVQGCSLACPGCLVPQSWPRRGGYLRTIEQLLIWIGELNDIEGLTLSGGEPMEQAALLAELIVQVRSQRDLGVVCYTGYRYEELQAPEQQKLLQQVDLLVDGPYQRALHQDLLWRASSNQRLLYLSPRYSAPDQDLGVGLEYRFESTGRFTFAGVPPWPDYVKTAPFQ